MDKGKARGSRGGSDDEVEEGQIVASPLTFNNNTMAKDSNTPSRRSKSKSPNRKRGSRSKSASREHGSRRHRSHSRERRRRRSASRSGSRSPSRSPYNGPVIKDFRTRGGYRPFNRGFSARGRRPFARRGFIPHHHYSRRHHSRSRSRSRSKSRSPRRSPLRDRFVEPIASGSGTRNVEDISSVFDPKPDTEQLNPADIKKKQEEANLGFLAMLEKRRETAKMIPIKISTQSLDDAKNHGFVSTFAAVGTPDSQSKHALSVDLENDGWQVVDDAKDDHHSKDRTPSKDRRKNSESGSSKKKKKSKRDSSSSEESDDQRSKSKDRKKRDKKKKRKKAKKHRKHSDSSSDSEDDEDRARNKSKKKRKSSIKIEEDPSVNEDADSTAEATLLNDGPEAVVKKKGKHSKRGKRHHSFSSDSDSDEKGSKRKHKKKHRKSKRSKKRRRHTSSESTSSDSSDSSDSMDDKKKSHKKKKHHRKSKKSKSKRSESSEKQSSEGDQASSVDGQAGGDVSAPPLIASTGASIQFTSTQPVIQYAENSRQGPDPELLANEYEQFMSQVEAPPQENDSSKNDNLSSSERRALEKQKRIEISQREKDEALSGPSSSYYSSHKSDKREKDSDKVDIKSEDRSPRRSSKESSEGSAKKEKEGRRQSRETEEKKITAKDLLERVKNKKQDGDVKSDKRDSKSSLDSKVIIGKMKSSKRSFTRKPEDPGAKAAERINSDYLWYQHYYATSYNLDHYSASYSAYYTMVTSGDYAQSDITAWMEQQGYSYPSVYDANGALIPHTSLPTDALADTITVKLENGSADTNGHACEPAQAIGVLVPSVPNSANEVCLCFLFLLCHSHSFLFVCSDVVQQLRQVEQ